MAHFAEFFEDNSEVVIPSLTGLKNKTPRDPKGF